ncbi:MAG: PEP-CTERM sorting domain-containing protein [Alishewanella agri]|nr:PEP-CTERM sorting domain-containing protein [Alishewanella agri]
MKKSLFSMLVVAGLTLSAFVQASPILLDTITHNYGNQHYVPNSVKANKNGNCDSADADWLVIKDRDNCQRFYDNFSFADLAYQSIDSFELSLSYSRTDNINWFINWFLLIPVLEQWQVRPGVSSSIPGYQYFDLKLVGNTITSGIFTFTRNNLAIFDQIVNAKNFSLWFAEDAWGANDFRLYSASLNVYGSAPQITPQNPDTTVAVPAPAGIALFGLGLTLLGFARRNKRK